VAIQLNHTIVWSKNKQASAKFLTELFGLPEARPFGPFLVVDLANGISLDFYEQDETQLQHYAFLVSDAEFDAIFARIRERGLDYWADPGKSQPGEINHHYNGRGVYFSDPSGHLLEIITTPYGTELPR
jgi:catechol 2,3-dioxygenase-like lactoylglutathione lyase family enzyme